MADFRHIITHPGGAHQDEVLACAVLLAVQPVSIERREPTPDDLADASVAVVDVGHRHEPSLHNFDHHQLPKDHLPTCALSLVLQHLGLYEDARRFCDWLETVEYFDTRGPVETARWLGTTAERLRQLQSPLQTTLIRRFSQVPRLEPGEPLWEMLRAVGEDLVAYLRALRTRLDELEQRAEFWTLELNGRPAQVLFLPRTGPPLDDPSLGLDRFIEGRGLAAEMVAVVSPDRRGTGYGLERFRDNPRLDFTRVADHPGVHFAHARGFVAKTSMVEREQLVALLSAAAV